MIYKILLIVLFIYSSNASGFRGYNEIDINEREEISDPYIIFSNFTSDVYTEDGKTYCIFYNRTNITEGYKYPEINYKFPYFMNRDRIKESFTRKIKEKNCIKFKLYHPFIINNKECYVSAEYEYQNKTFVHKIHFKIHENNILCFALTIVCGIIVHFVGLAIYAYKLKKDHDLSEMKDCIEDSLFCCPCYFSYYALIMILSNYLLGYLLTAIMLAIYPYSFVGLGVVAGGLCTLYLRATGCTINIDHYIMVVLEIKLKDENYKKLYVVEVGSTEYDLLDKQHGTVKIDDSKTAKYGYDDIKYKGTETYYYKENIWKLVWGCCSVICCVILLIVFFAVTVLRKNILKSGKGVVLALEYYTMIVVCYTVILLISFFVYSIKLNYLYWKKKCCCCCSGGSQIQPY